MERELPRLRQEMVAGRLNSISVNSLSDISKHPLFLEDGKAIIVDLDGVLCCRGKENNVMSNVLRLRSLLRIAEGTDRILFSTGRVNLQGDGLIKRYIREEVDAERESSKLAVSHCPFLTPSSEEFLESLIHRINPECSVEFDATPKKFLGTNESTLKFGMKVLDDGLNLAIVGSGAVDKIMAKKIVKNNRSSGKITFFSTGWGLI